jgi:hypothetical protein
LPWMLEGCYWPPEPGLWYPTSKFWAMTSSMP